MPTKMHRFLISMTDDELSLLDATCKKLHVNRSQLLRAFFSDSNTMRQSILAEINSTYDAINNTASAREHIDYLKNGNLPFLPPRHK